MSFADANAEYERLYKLLRAAPSAGAAREVRDALYDHLCAARTVPGFLEVALSDYVSTLERANWQRSDNAPETPNPPPAQ